jgi:selenocysteine lyase/cysteine desulfurase
LDVEKIRQDFPILNRTFKVFADNNKVPPIYLDHAASTHPPIPVLNAHGEFMKNHYANIHRGMHYLSQEASIVFDEVPEIITNFIGSSCGDDCIILCSNTTDALDLAGFVEKDTPGMTLTTVMEHHSNDLVHRKYGRVIHACLTPEGALDLDDVEKKFAEHTIKLFAVTGASNVTGYMPPIHKLAKLAHEHGARILVDAAQLFAHYPIDVYPLDHPEHIDYLAAAGHKSYAPFGSAFLYGPRETLDKVNPRIPGGGTVRYVTTEEVLWVDSPDRHQGGTPNIGGAVAFASAVLYLKKHGMENIREHERSLFIRMYNKLKDISGLTLYGPSDIEQKIGVVPFNIDGIHHTKGALMLNWEKAIACRNGCFCAHPYLHHLLTVKELEELKQQIRAGENPVLPGAIRASLGLYNNEKEIDIFIETLTDITNGKIHGDYSNLEALNHQIDFFKISHAKSVPFTDSDIDSP